jgi:CheY-like chemotaxis protein
MVKTKNFKKQVKILMVEDNYADIDMMKRYLRESVFPITVEVAVDGEDALTVLRQSRDFTAREDPDFILLDINLPKKNGLELLAEIKGDSGLKHIPVVVLSCSSNENDIERAYRNRADLYIVKPENLDQYADVVKSIDDFWIKNKKEEY